MQVKSEGRETIPFQISEVSCVHVSGHWIRQNAQEKFQTRDGRSKCKSRKNVSIRKLSISSCGFVLYNLIMHAWEHPAHRLAQAQ